MLVTTYTDAPEIFDGFGTRTVRVVGLLDSHMGPRVVREVETPLEHVDWQRIRYNSGCYLSASATELPRLAGLIRPVV